MQKVIEFGRRKFWSSSIDVEKLNETLAQCNAEGWQVNKLSPNTSAFGGLCSYTILLEKSEAS